jgi:hypothetical protein
VYVVEILVEKVDVDKVKFVQVKKKLRPFNGATLVIKWHSLWATDELPVIVMNDLFGEEDVLHAYVLNLGLSTSKISYQDIIYLEVTQFLSVVSEDLVLNPLPDVILTCFLSALDLVFVQIRRPAECKNIELLFVLVEILLALDVGVVRHGIDEVILHYIEYHEPILGYIWVFLINEWNKVDVRHLVWDLAAGDSNVSVNFFLVILDYFALTIDVDGLELVVPDVDEPNRQELSVGNEKQDLVFWLDDIHDGSLLEELLHLIPCLSNKNVGFPSHLVVIDWNLNATFFQLDCVEYLEYKDWVFFGWLVE